NIGELCRCTFEFPGEVVPLNSRGHMAGDAGGKPFSLCVSINVPDTGRNVAFSTEDPSHVAIGLVIVKFERLGVLRRLQVKVNVVNQVGGAISCSELLPPEGIRI